MVKCTHFEMKLTIGIKHVFAMLIMSTPINFSQKIYCFRFISKLIVLFLVGTLPVSQSTFVGDVSTLLTS